MAAARGIMLQKEGEGAKARLGQKSIQELGPEADPLGLTPIISLAVPPPLPAALPTQGMAGSSSVGN